MDRARLKLRALIRELEEKRARHTELVTVYIPQGYSIVSVQQQIAGELGTAKNIKSTATRKNVQGALEKMIQQLKVYKQTPPHGLAVFSGNVSEKEGGSDFIVRAVEPPEPLNLKVYRCDQRFFLDPLVEQLRAQSVYGLIVLDNQEGNVALLSGTRIVQLKDMDSLVPGKTAKGGQSAARFARVREGMKNDFYKEVAEAANKSFLNHAEIKGIIIGGPGPTKEDFVNGNYLNNELRKKIVGIKDVGYTGQQGLQELVNRSKDILEREEIVLEKAAVDRFMEVLAKRPALAAYGQSEIEDAITAGAVDLLLLSEEVDPKLVEELADRVEDMGGKWIIVSVETREGAQLKGLGGIAAVLRFAIK